MNHIARSTQTDQNLCTKVGTLRLCSIKFNSIQFSRWSQLTEHTDLHMNKMRCVTIVYAGRGTIDQWALPLKSYTTGLSLQILIRVSRILTSSADDVIYLRGGRLKPGCIQWPHYQHWRTLTAQYPAGWIGVEWGGRGGGGEWGGGWGGGYLAACWSLCVTQDINQSTPDG